MAKMSLDSLKALLNSEKAAALSAMQSAKLSTERQDAMLYYLGDMSKDMPAQEGRSATVSTDVADTVEGLLPQLMDIFAGSDEVVRFEPVGPEDEEAAQQETDYVNHVFMQQNPGFMILYTFLKDGLLQKNGFVKVFWEETQKEEKETYLGLGPDQFAMLANDVLQSEGKLEIIEHDEGNGQHNVKILRTRKIARARVIPVPPEEFGIARGARTIPESNYCFHLIRTQTEGSLIEQGFDAEDIKKLPTYSFTDNAEQLARDTVDEQMWLTESGNRTARPVEIIEHYIWMDYDGKDKPCLYKVTTGSQCQVLNKDGKPDVEEFDAMPFAAATPVPIPHRFFGRSIADLVMSAQREKTALKRGALDNLYLTLNPRVEVAEANAGPNTLDDLLVSRPGGVVRTKTAGGLAWQTVPDITGSVYPMMQYVDAELEARTGLSKQSQGIDANALQNQSATAVAQVFSASQLRVKLIARAMAEGVRDIFSLLHMTIRKHGQEEQTARLRNSWTRVNPRQWKTREDMTIHVGLGTGGKAQQFAQLMALGNFQKELLLGGKANLVDDKALYNMGAELIKIMGHKNPDKFLNDPDAKDPNTNEPLHPPVPPPVPEAIQVAQLNAQTEKEKLGVQSQFDAQADERKAQIESVQMQADIEANNKKIEAQILADREKAAAEERLAVLQFQLAESRSQREHEYKMAQLQAKGAMDREKHDQQMEAGTLKAIQAYEANEKKMEAATGGED